MATCRRCGQADPLISKRLGFCAPCIRGHFKEVWQEIEALHHESRRPFGLPVKPPQDPQGKRCTLCFHACRIPEGSHGYCGARRVEGGSLKGGNPIGAGLNFYYDRLPTNCVADWFCPEGRRAARLAGETRFNLAVFYHACNFNCLFCQNWTFKKATYNKEHVTAPELARAAHSRTACVCYFGGDPTPQLPHALVASRLALAQARQGGRSLRLCWETNGAMQEEWLRPLAESALTSGGVIKFDLKAFSEEVHLSLCGVSNAQTLTNFARLAARFGERPDDPFLTASTLMVPGYVDLEEIHGLARFITLLNPDIPYSLLGFYPQFVLNDLPITSRLFAFEAKAAAEAAGLRRVNLGNVHLLR